MPMLGWNLEYDDAALAKVHEEYVIDVVPGAVISWDTKWGK